MPKDDPVMIVHVISRGTHFVVTTPDGPVLHAKIGGRGMSMSAGGMTMDEDFERIEIEAGKFMWFECHGDSRVRRYFQQRGIIDAETLAPREHTWVVAYGKPEGQGLSEFRGRLYDYHEEPINANKAFKITGRIRISHERAGQSRGQSCRDSPKRATPPSRAGHAAITGGQGTESARPELPWTASSAPAEATPPGSRSGGFDQMLGFYRESYFVVEAPDGDALHILITNSHVKSRSKRDPLRAANGPTDEVGIHFVFKCVGNHRAKGYLFGRSVLQGNGKPSEHEWTIEHSGLDGVPRQCRFAATLHDYRERQLSSSEWAFLGVLTMPFPEDA